MIFNKFRKLNILSISIDGFLPNEQCVFHNLRKNYSVRKLLVVGYNYKLIKLVQGIICNLPNIETLELRGFETRRKLMVLIAKNLCKLKNLILFHVGAKLFDGVYIPSLKSINISCHRLEFTQSDWVAMVRGMPNIENFSLVNYSGDKENQCSNEAMHSAIPKGWTHLKHFKLHGFSIVDFLLPQLLLNCKELQTVEIHSYSFFKTPPGFREAILRKLKILRAREQNNFSFFISCGYVNHVDPTVTDATTSHSYCNRCKQFNSLNV